MPGRQFGRQQRWTRAAIRLQLTLDSRRASSTLLIYGATATAPCSPLFSAHTRSQASMTGAAPAGTLARNVTLFQPSCAVSAVMRLLGMVMVKGRVNTVGSV